MLVLSLIGHVIGFCVFNDTVYDESLLLAD